LLSLAACTNNREVASHWTAQPVTVDGWADEWTEMPLNSFEESSLSWGIMNDANNLYLLLVTWNESLINSIHTVGVTLWFDRSDKSKNDIGIRFSGAAGLSQFAGERVVDGHKQDARDVPHGEASPLIVTVLQYGKPFPVPDKSEHAPAAVASCADGTCSYEVRIPLGTQPEGFTVVPVTPGAPVRLRAGYTMAYLSPAARSETSRGSAAMSGRGAGMGGTGGPTGGMGGASGRSKSGGDRERNQEKNVPKLEPREVVVYVNLAVPPAN